MMISDFEVQTLENRNRQPQIMKTGLFFCADF